MNATFHRCEKEQRRDSASVGGTSLQDSPTEMSVGTLSQIFLLFSCIVSLYTPLLSLEMRVKVQLATNRGLLCRCVVAYLRKTIHPITEMLYHQAQEAGVVDSAVALKIKRVAQPVHFILLGS